jgi:hypothetical protein
MFRHGPTRNHQSVLCRTFTSVELSCRIDADNQRVNIYCIFLIRLMGRGVQTGSTRNVGRFWPIVPAPSDREDGEFGGMNIGRGNRITLRKPAPEPLSLPQIPLDQTRERTRAAAGGSQRLTT